MNPTISPQLASAALRNALPYLRLFQGKTFVLKAGGEAFSDPRSTRDLLEQISILHRLQMSVVLVHGGGPQITALSERLDLAPHFEAGRRVTTPDTLSATVMTLCGTINKWVVATLRELETSAVGLSGADGGLITAVRRPPQKLDDGRTVDYGEVGDIESIDGRVLTRLLADGFLPVVSPVCATKSGELLNVNADSVASHLAAALGAEKLIYLTGAPGILENSEDPSSLISYTDIRELVELREKESLRDGMLPKISSITHALEGGVPRVHVISHRAPDSLLIEVFTNGGSGTMVVLDTKTLLPEEVEK